MRAAGSPLADRFVSTATWIVLVAVLAAAGATLALAPSSGGRPRPGDIVSYSEDLIGRPWRVVGEHEFGRYLIRNGKIKAIADAHEIKPYAGYSENVTVLMAGEQWRHKVEEIRQKRFADNPADQRL